MSDFNAIVSDLDMTDTVEMITKLAPHEWKDFDGLLDDLVKGNAKGVLVWMSYIHSQNPANTDLVASIGEAFDGETLEAVQEFVQAIKNARDAFEQSEQRPEALPA